MGEGCAAAAGGARAAEEGAVAVAAAAAAGAAGEEAAALAVGAVGAAAAGVGAAREGAPAARAAGAVTATRLQGRRGASAVQPQNAEWCTSDSLPPGPTQPIPQPRRAPRLWVETRTPAHSPRPDSIRGSAAVRLVMMSWQAQAVLPSNGLTVQGAAASAVTRQAGRRDAQA